MTTAARLRKLTARLTALRAAERDAESDLIRIRDEIGWINGELGVNGLSRYSDSELRDELARRDRIADDRPREERDDRETSGPTVRG